MSSQTLQTVCHSVKSLSCSLHPACSKYWGYQSVRQLRKETPCQDPPSPTVKSRRCITLDIPLLLAEKLPTPTMTAPEDQLLGQVSLRNSPKIRRANQHCRRQVCGAHGSRMRKCPKPKRLPHPPYLQQATAFLLLHQESLQ